MTTDPTLLIRTLAALLAKHVQRCIDNGTLTPETDPGEAMVIHTALAQACACVGVGYDPGDTVLLNHTLVYENIDLTDLAAQLDPGPVPPPSITPAHIATNLNRVCLSLALAAIGRQWQPFVGQTLREYATTPDLTQLQKTLNTRMHAVWASDPQVGRAHRLLKPFGLRFAGFTIAYDDEDDFVYATVRTKPLVPPTT